MSTSGGKYVPFNMASFNPNDYQHLRDPATASFAKVLGKGRSMSPSDVAASLSPQQLSGVDVGENDDNVRARNGKLAALSAEDLIKFAESEGTTVEQLCRKEPCREVIQRLLFNEQFKKMQFDQLCSDLVTAQNKLGHCQEEEVELVERLQVLTKEEKDLSEMFAELQSKDRELSQTTAELKKEKASFNDRQFLLESQVKIWTNNLAKSQQALSRAIWKKPGAALDDDSDGVSFRSSGGSTVANMSRYDESRLERITSPSKLPYGRLAGDGVLDFSETRALRLAGTARARATAFSARQTWAERDSLSSCGSTDYRTGVASSSRSLSGTLAISRGGNAITSAASLPSPNLNNARLQRKANTTTTTTTKNIRQLLLLDPISSSLSSPIKVVQPDPFRVGVSSTSLSLEIGKSAFERGRGARDERGRGRKNGEEGGGGSRERGYGYNEDDQGVDDSASVFSSLSALTSSTIGIQSVTSHSHSHSQVSSGSGCGKGRHKLGVVRVKHVPIVVPADPGISV